MNRQQLIEKRDKVFNQLVASGMDYDDARFAVMTAGANFESLLEDQPASENELVKELATMRAESTYAEETKVKATGIEQRIAQNESDLVAYEQHQIDHDER